MSEQNETGPAEQPAGKTVTEEIKVQARDLSKTIGDIIREGTVRRVMVIRKGRTLLDIPLVAGAAVGAVVVFTQPWIAALAAAGALLGGFAVRIERDAPKAE
jgi:hypothetical protein